MSIRHAFLALLSERPMNGYQLRQEFDTRTGGAWPLNIGQAYTTLGRLERDRLVVKRDADEASGDVFTLSDQGRAEATRWWQSAVGRDAPARDEVAIKLALAVTVPGVDVQAVVAVQRAETMRALHEYTHLKLTTMEAAGGLGRADLAWSLVLDSLIFKAEAETRWLDHIEGTLARAERDSHASAAVPVEPGAPPSARSARQQRPAMEGASKVIRGASTRDSQGEPR
ncbi:PadR family transcriptional regulator [Rarobacter incanus]|uniref:Virulence activator alpha n=1 Tax=Rarobacter incanus TaxID=153494 RepID=A0A542SPD0_9MICO|nr:helix-turn-helix transcriptional regulator [Rarobacter incanus]TQK76476.1 virulence activator alpha [Rarobacter incanus]